MSIEKCFNLRRFYFLVKKDFYVKLRSLTTGMIAAFSVLLILDIFTSGNTSGSVTLYFFILFIGGIWLASQSFTEIHHKIKGGGFFLLPCSQFEKFLSKLLQTSVIYIFLSLMLYFCFSLLTASLTLLLFQRIGAVFNPLQGEVWSAVLNCIVWQAIFLLGSVYFNKHVVAKTALWISCFVLTLTLFFFVSSWLFYGHPVFVNFLSFYNNDVQLLTIVNIIKNILWFGLAPFCWTVTYLRLKEKEV